MTPRDKLLAAARAIACAEPDTIEGYTPEELFRIGLAVARSPFSKLLPDALTPEERSYAATRGHLSTDAVDRLMEEAYPRKP